MRLGRWLSDSAIMHQVRLQLPLSPGGSQIDPLRPPRFWGSSMREGTQDKDHSERLTISPHASDPFQANFSTMAVRTSGCSIITS